MKRTLATLAVMALPLAAHAQATLNSTSATETNVASLSAVNINTKGSEIPKTQTLKTAPSLGSIVISGGHPCAMSPLGIQASVIGGAAGIGGQKIDYGHCFIVWSAMIRDVDPDLSRKLMYAGVYMAAENKKAREALIASGAVVEPTAVSNHSTSGKARSRKTFSTRNAAEPLVKSAAMTQINRRAAASDER